MYYAIELTINYDDQITKGLYAGMNQHRVPQIAVHPDDEFNQYVHLEIAQREAVYISDKWTKKIIDSEGKLIASFNRAKKTWAKQTEAAIA